MSINLDIVEQVVKKCLSTFDDKIESIVTAIRRLENKIDVLQETAGSADYGNSYCSEGNKNHIVPPLTAKTKLIADKILTSSMNSKTANAVNKSPTSARSKRALSRQLRDNPIVNQSSGISHNSQTQLGTAPASQQRRLSASASSTTRSTDTTTIPKTSLTKQDNNLPPRRPTPNQQADSLKSTDAPTDTDWQKVNNKKRSHRKVIVGSGQRDNDIQTIERIKKLHVCFFHPDTTEDTIKTYLTKKDSSHNYTVQKLTLKHNHYASFAVTVPTSKYDFFMKPEQWPSGTEVSPWNFRRASRPSRGHRTAHAPGVAGSEAAGAAPAPTIAPPRAIPSATTNSTKKQVNK